MTDRRPDDNPLPPNPPPEGPPVPSIPDQPSQPPGAGQAPLPRDDGALDPPTPEPEPPSPAEKEPVSEEERRLIVQLHDAGVGTRKIAPKVGRCRDVVRRILREEGRLSTKRSQPTKRKTPGRPSKLDPFRERVTEKVRAGLTGARILREIQAEGYEGGRTILNEFVRSVRAPLAPKRKTFRRFETAPAEECQVDWSLYRVLIGGVALWVYALAVVLAYSRKAFVAFFPNQKLPTLLEGLMAAFSTFEGVTRRVVFDNMATVVLGRVGRRRKPIWNPRFLEFAKYYGFEPYLCRVRDPNRKGIVEAYLHFVERDFVRGSAFDSLDDMNRAARRWLDEVANRRRHGTTRLVPEEAWRQERDFLIALPDKRFAGACEQELRRVARDATISVRGTAYTVPAELAHTTVTVRLYSGRFEVLDEAGRVVLSRGYATGDEKGRLQIDPDHYRNLPRQPEGHHGVVVRLEDAFLERFPALADLHVGLKTRMKGLVHVHLRILLRLADAYGDEAFLTAAKRAQAYRRFNAHAVRRILEKRAPLPPDESGAPLDVLSRLHTLLGEVDSGSLDDYSHLDTEARADDESDGPDGGEPTHAA